jgi:anti-anti-sigma factor
MKLSVVSIDRHLVRIEAEGEITMRDFRAEGPDPFEALLGSSWPTHKVVLDFRKVNFVDSSAIGWLMTCRREFDRSGGLFLIHSIQPRVRQVLDLLRVGKALPLLRDEREALRVATASAAPAPALAAPAPPPAPPAPAAVAPAPLPPRAKQAPVNVTQSPANVPQPAPYPEATEGPFEVAPLTPSAKPKVRKRKVA